MMATPVFQAIPVVYTGRFADDHLVDAQQFGKSLVGASRVANSLCHWFLFAEVTTDNRRFQVRFFVGPSRENGLVQEIVAVMNSGAMPMFTPILMGVAKIYIERVWDAVIHSILNRKSEVEVAIEGMLEIVRRYDDFAQRVHDGQMRDKAWLQHMVDKLVAANRSALRDLPEPIGKSVREMQIGESSVGPAIDEPAAEVLRAHEPMEVGDTLDYDVTVEGVFKTNGACRLKILGEDRIVAGKITDPALSQPGNVYTTALNEGLALHVTAKPTLKAGELHPVFVSDAKIVRA
jgi:hypothetical protein